MTILVLNTGSSSLKFGWYDADSLAPLGSGESDGVDARAVEDAIGRATGPISIVAHRVVHGGTVFRAPTLVDARVTAAIRDLESLAPLHNPRALAAIDAVERRLPGVPQAAVFDTAFFAGFGPRQFLYPLPYDWFTAYGIRRFGFHGISHASCARRTADLMNRPLSDVRLITCHLGSGCSAAAIDRGVPVGTSMGFSPLDGMMMGSRPGSVDPGIFPYLQQHQGLGAAELDHALNYASGLLGVSGVSSDYRRVLDAAEQGHARARLALDLFADRVQETIAALSTRLDRVDAVAFAGGIGEHAAGLRADVASALGALGVLIDAGRNAAAGPDTEITAAASRVRVFVVHADEERLMAGEARTLLRERERAGAAPAATTNR